MTYDPEYQRGRSGRPIARIRTQIRREGSHICWICSSPIDMTLNAQTDANGWTIDHVLPLSLYPHLALDITNMREAHRKCNSSRGNAQGKGKGKISRNW
jgi:5-methylcytosine-specific restriction endonuclease McrA